MKKVLLFIVMLASVVILTGCDSMMNTPTKRVEDLLSKYQTEDKDVLSQLDKTITDESILDTGLKDRYRELMKKQYKDLTYKIKNETIDGNTAVVETEIEVYDFNSAIKEIENAVTENNSDYVDDTGTVSTSKYNEDKIKKMEDAKNRVTYTINFTVSKINDKWVVDDLTETERLKLHGLYAY